MHACVFSVAQYCLTLCDPLNCSPPGSSFHGIFQARILEWVAISFSRGSSHPKDRTRVSYYLTPCHLGSPSSNVYTDLYTTEYPIRPTIFIIVWHIPPPEWHEIIIFKIIIKLWCFEMLWKIIMFYRHSFISLLQSYYQVSTILVLILQREKQIYRS